MAKWMHEFVRMAVCSVDNPDMLVEAGGFYHLLICPIMPPSLHAWAGARNSGQRHPGGGAVG